MKNKKINIISYNRELVSWQSLVPLCTAPWPSRSSPSIKKEHSSYLRFTWSGTDSLTGKSSVRKYEQPPFFLLIFIFGKKPDKKNSLQVTLLSSWSLILVLTNSWERRRRSTASSANSSSTPAHPTHVYSCMFCMAKDPDPNLSLNKGRLCY